MTSELRGLSHFTARPMAVRGCASGEGRVPLQRGCNDNQAAAGENPGEQMPWISSRVTPWIIVGLCICSVDKLVASHSRKACYYVRSLNAISAISISRRCALLRPL